MGSVFDGLTMTTFVSLFPIIVVVFVDWLLLEVELSKAHTPVGFS